MAANLGAKDAARMGILVPASRLTSHLAGTPAPVVNVAAPHFGRYAQNGAAIARTKVPANRNRANKPAATQMQEQMKSHQQQMKSHRQQMKPHAQGVVSMSYAKRPNKALSPRFEQAPSTRKSGSQGGARVAAATLPVVHDMNTCNCIQANYHTNLNSVIAYSFQCATISLVGKSKTGHALEHTGQYRVWHGRGVRII